MNDAVRNERAKLSANYANSIAIALSVVGGLTPLAAAFQEGGLPSLLLVLISVVRNAISFALHLLARRLLGSLVP